MLGMCCWGATALLLAVQEQHEAAVRVLLSVPDIDVNLADEAGQIPLSIAAKLQNPEIVRLLLSHPKVDVNADIIAADDDSLLRTRNYPLLCSVVVKLPAEDAKRQLAILRLLLSSPDVNVDKRCEDGSTALALACMFGFTDAAMALIDKQADCNLGPGGSTALHQALLGSKNVDIVKKLLKVPGLNLMQACENGWTPFDLCSEREEGTMKELAGLLLEELRSRNCTSSRDIARAIYWSFEVGSGWTAELLLRSMPNLEVQTLSALNSYLHLAAKEGNEKTVRGLLSVPGIDLGAQQDGLVAFQTALVHGHLECALLSVGEA